MNLFVPSMMVDLVVRFDESAEIEVDGGRTERLVTRPGENNLSFHMSIPVRHGNVHLDGHRKAGTFNVVVPWSQFPLDSNLVSAVGVHVHLGCVPLEDYKAGMLGRKRADGTLLSQIQTRNVAGQPNPETLLVIGTADKVNTSWAGKQDDVSFEGRDHRGLLLDSPFDPSKLHEIDTSKPIDDVVRQIIRHHRLLSPLVHVITHAREWDGPLPAPAAEVPRTQRGATAQGRPHASAPSDGGKLSFWDLIVQYCFLVGVVPRVVGDDVVLQRARNIYTDARMAGRDPRYPTAFADGSVRTVDGEDIHVRRMVLGHEVDSLSFHKQLTGNRGKVVEVVSVDTSATAAGVRGRLLKARWPERGAHSSPTATAPEGNDHQRDVLRIPVNGVRSQEQLLNIARSIHEEVSRGEVGGEFKTKALASFGGGNADPDLVRLRPGDGMELLLDTARLNSRSPRVSSVLSMGRGTFAEQVAHVRQTVPNENLARALVAGARGNSRAPKRFYYVTGVTFEYGDKQCSVGCDFNNYVDAHTDRSDTANANATRAAGTPARETAGAAEERRQNERLTRDISQADADLRNALARERGERAAGDAADAARREAIDRAGTATRNGQDIDVSLDTAGGA